MDKKMALEFLRRHQPMPLDDSISTELISEYDQVRRFFIEQPDPECIPLFLNSFGNGSGFGIYQLVDEVFRMYSSEDVLPSLIRTITDGQDSARYWAAQIAADFPVPELVTPLGNLAKSTSLDLRSAAITALFDIKDDRVDNILRDAFDQEEDDELKEQIADAIAFRQER